MRTLFALLILSISTLGACGGLEPAEEQSALAAAPAKTSAECVDDYITCTTNCGVASKTCLFCKHNLDVCLREASCERIRATCLSNCHDRYCRLFCALDYDSCVNPPR